MCLKELFCPKQNERKKKIIMDLYVDLQEIGDSHEPDQEMISEEQLELIEMLLKTFENDYSRLCDFDDY